MKRLSESQLKRMLKKIGGKGEGKPAPKPDKSPFVTSFLHKIIKRGKPTLVFALVALSQTLLADFAGKCVGVSDGDTISVMKDGMAVKIRLDGVDCPESSQDFGTKAKTFTSEMVFGKNVEIKEKQKDRYGRTVGTVLIDGKNLNLELLKAGLAWHYKQYSKDEAYAEAEKKAREQKAGLWSLPNPTPPWEFRGNKSAKADTKTEAASGQEQNIEQTVYITPTGKKYHREGCLYLKDSKIQLNLEDAKNKGYEPCKVCKP